MKVLLVSKFLHHVGGVETYLTWLAEALIGAGHEVEVVGMTPPDGDEIMHLGGAKAHFTPSRQFTRGSLVTRAKSGLQSVYSPATARVVDRTLQEFQPDVVHFHGTCYQLTSSVVAATRARGFRRLATVHEYKLTCANQRLWDDSTGAVCTACIGADRLSRLANPVVRKCIKGSGVASLLGGLEAVVSDVVWRGDEELQLLAPSKFMAKVLEDDGWQSNRISVLDLPWTGLGSTSPPPSQGASGDFLSMGRLAPEKDLATVLEGWRRAAGHTGNRRLLVAGDGESAEQLRRQVHEDAIERVEFLGRLTRAEIDVALAATAATIHPAAWYENSPLAVRESLTAGVPALVADTGGMPELVRPWSGTTVNHDATGWADAFVRFPVPGLLHGRDLVSAVSGYATTERRHLEKLLEHYAG